MQLEERMIQTLPSNLLNQQQAAKLSFHPTRMEEVSTSTVFQPRTSMNGGPSRILQRPLDAFSLSEIETKNQSKSGDRCYGLCKKVGPDYGRVFSVCEAGVDSKTKAFRWEKMDWNELQAQCEWVERESVSEKNPNRWYSVLVDPRSNFWVKGTFQWLDVEEKQRL